MNQKITRFIGSVKLGVKRNAPELLLGGALLTGTATVILSSRATLKAKEIKDNFKDQKEVLESDYAIGSIDYVEMKKTVKHMYKKYAVALAKEYAIPAGLYAATVAMIYSSYKIQKDRQIALSAALTACTTAYSTLVNKLKKGAAAGLTAKEVLDGIEAREKVDPETGEVTLEKYQGEPVSTEMYKFRFDRYSLVWEKDKFQNESTLRGEQNWANDKLRLQGYLFLNDVLDRLGIPATYEGQIVGWLAEGDGDGFVDFGMFDCEDYEDVRYDNNAFDLNFNVDGDILSKFKQNKKIM